MGPNLPNHQEPQRPSHQLATWSVIGAVAVLVVGLVSVRMEHQPDNSRDYPSRPLLADAVPVLLPPPPMNDEYDPCSDCHEEEEPNPAVRELEDEHDTMELKHGELWCLHCHDLENREKLHLADGSLVEFADSWRLCTQCHAKKLGDWRAGVHGKRTGHWRGTKEYRTCVNCHDPHAPPFKALEPKPSPLRPTQIALKPTEEEAVASAEP